MIGQLFLLGKRWPIVKPPDLSETLNKSEMWAECLFRGEQGNNDAI